MRGVWSDGVTVWVVDSADKKVYAYNAGTKARDSGKDFGTLSAAGNDDPVGIWSDGTTVWIGDSVDDKVYAYNLSTKARDSGKDFGTLSAAGNGDPAGLWSDGAVMWVADSGDDKVYAYTLSTKARAAGRDFDSLDAAGNDDPWGIWSDGTTMWVGDREDDELYAYDLGTTGRNADLDIDSLGTTGNGDSYGVWGDGASVWVGDGTDDKLYGYGLPGYVPDTEVSAVGASGGGSSDYFGYAVAVDGEYAVVGEYSNDDGNGSAGAAYVFKRGADGRWGQEAKLQASNRGGGDYFGYSVGISGDTVVVGAPYEDTYTTNTGMVYVFTRSGSSWTEQAKFQASNRGYRDFFGWSVAVDGDTIVVGAYGEDTGGSDAGMVYVFTGSGSSWTERKKLQASNKGSSDYFGHSVAIDDGTIVVGAPYEDTGSSDAGMVYVFTGSGASWTERATLQASNKGNNDHFGWSVDVDGDTIVVGARYEDTGGTNAGMVYVFVGSGSSWDEEGMVMGE